MAELNHAMNPGSTDFEAHLQRLLEDPLHAARAASRSGTRVVGYIGNDVPVELIAAADALPVRLRGLPGGATTLASDFLESAHAPELRVIVEQWLAGALDFLDAVVFPRTDDSAQRLYYYLCELQRRRLCGGPRPLLYDVANLQRPSSREYTRESTRRLAQALGTRDSRLEAAAKRVAQRGALLAEIRLLRAADAPLPGNAAWRLERASACDWRDGFDTEAGRWLTQAATLDAPRRILLAGDPPPADSLHRAIENAGGSVVLESTESLAGPLTLHGDPRDAIADHFHARRNPVLEMRGDDQWLARVARDSRADGVVLWLIEEDEALPWEIARQVRALRAADVPTLLLSRQPWQVDERALRQVEAFVGALEVKP